MTFKFQVKNNSEKALECSIRTDDTSVYFEINEHIVCKVNKCGTLDTAWCCVESGFANAGKLKENIYD